MRRKSYVSPLILAAQLPVDDDPIIVIGGSMETGGIGDCFAEEDMLTGQPGAKVYFLGPDGERTFVGYHNVRDGEETSGEYFDVDGNLIDLCEYMCDDFEMYVGEVYGLWCDNGMGGL